MKNEIVLRDSNNEIVNIGDDLISKNVKLNRLSLYKYVQDDKGGLWLYKYDKSSKLHEDDMGNIRIDPGVSLSISEDSIWLIYKGDEAI